MCVIYCDLRKKSIIYLFILLHAVLICSTHLWDHFLLFYLNKSKTQKQLYCNGGRKNMIDGGPSLPMCSPQESQYSA